MVDIEVKLCLLLVLVYAKTSAQTESCQHPADIHQNDQIPLTKLEGKWYVQVIANKEFAQPAEKCKTETNVKNANGKSGYLQTLSSLKQGSNEHVLKTFEMREEQPGIFIKTNPDNAMEKIVNTMMVFDHYREIFITYSCATENGQFKKDAFVMVSRRPLITVSNINATFKSIGSNISSQYYRHRIEHNTCEMTPVKS